MGLSASKRRTRALNIPLQAQQSWVPARPVHNLVECERSELVRVSLTTSATTAVQKPFDLGLTEAPKIFHIVSVAWKAASCQKRCSTVGSYWIGVRETRGSGHPRLKEPTQDLVRLIVIGIGCRHELLDSPIRP